MKKIMFFLILFVFIFFIMHNVYYRPPSFYIALMNFYLNKQSLNQVHNFMVNNKKIHELALAPDSNGVEAENVDRNMIELDEKTQKKFGGLLIELKTLWVTKKEWGWVYFLGADKKFNDDFNVAYVFFNDENIELPSCNSDVNYELAGVCAFHIEDNWFLHYEWHPVQPQILIEQKEPWPPKE